MAAEVGHTTAVQELRARTKIFRHVTIREHASPRVTHKMTTQQQINTIIFLTTLPHRHREPILADGVPLPRLALADLNNQQPHWLYLA